MSKEDESFLESKARAKKGQRGKSTETLIEAVLAEIKGSDPTFDYDRLPDTRMAGRIMPARVSDFTIFRKGQSFSLEVKEVKKDTWRFSLGKKPFPQFPRMQRRELAGCPGLLIVHLIHHRVWVYVWTRDITQGLKSLDCRLLQHYDSAKTVFAAAMVCRSASMKDGEPCGRNLGDRL